MNSIFSKKTHLFMTFIILILFYMLFTKYHILSSKENYTNYSLEEAEGKYPYIQKSVLVQDSFPRKENKIGLLSKDQGSHIWWHYPIFEVGSFDQFTNNLKFSNNPDTGRCMPADVCGTLYKEYQTQSNYVYPLPPAKIPQCGTRINYFNTKVNLLPYRQDMQNILY